MFFTYFYYLVRVSLPPRLGLKHRVFQQLLDLRSCLPAYARTDWPGIKRLPGHALKKSYRIVVLTFFEFQTFLRQFVTENSENFYEDQKFMYTKL